VVWFGCLAEVGEQTGEAAGDGGVPFDLAGPAALVGVLAALLAVPAARADQAGLSAPSSARTTIRITAR
jgi:hypothetical protein